MYKICNIILLVMTLSVFVACEGDDPCENITCLNEGICDNGSCDCPVGFEGDTCEVEYRDRILGLYTYDSGTCNNYAPSIEVISNLENKTDIIIISEGSSGSTFETEFIIDSENTFVTSSGSLTLVFSNDMATLTGFGCDDIYVK